MAITGNLRERAVAHLSLALARARLDLATRIQNKKFIQRSPIAIAGSIARDADALDASSSRMARGMAPSSDGHSVRRLRRRAAVLRRGRGPSSGLIADLADRAEDAGGNNCGQIVNLHRSRRDSQRPARAQIRRDDYRALGRDAESAQLSGLMRAVEDLAVTRVLGQHAAHTSVRDSTC